MPATHNANTNVTNDHAAVYGKLGNNADIYQSSTTPRTSPPTTHSTPNRSLKPAIALGISLLDTDVSRHPAGSPKQIFPPQPPAGPTLRPNDGSGSLGTQAKRTRPTPSPLKLHRDLSPFDRYIPIALSVPAHKTAFNNGNDPRQCQLSPASANTPAIILTPTDDIHIPNASRTDPRRTVYPPDRPPSSVYMKAISTFARLPTPKKFGVPALPRLSQAKADAASAVSRRRALSDVTYIDDDSPCVIPFQKTPTATIRARPRASIETVPATPHRSNGWWNLLLSPLVARSNSSRSTKFSPTLADNIPEVPILQHAATIDGSTRSIDSCHDELDEKKTSSPATLPTFYMIPTVGEAAPYYDHLQDFSTPRLPIFTTSQDQDGTMPSRGDSKRTLNTLGSDSSQQEVGYSPEPDTIHEEKPAAPLYLDTRHLRTESAPDRTPPKSAMAEMFSHPDGGNSDRDILSPSPVVGVASAAWFQSARAVQHRSAEPAPETLPMPEPRSHQSTLAKLTAPPPMGPKASPPPLPPPPTDLARAGPVPPFTGQKTILSASDRTIDSLPPIPPAKDDEKSVPRDLSPDTEAGPGFFTRLFSKSDRHESQSKEAKSTNGTKPGLITKVLESELMTTHYASPPRLHVPDDSSSTKWWARHAFVLILAGSTFAVILLITLLALFVTQSHADMPVGSTWLNLTGFPPLATGVATVAQPSLVTDQGSCVKPDGLWSCALPRSQQVNNVPSGAIIPNFRLEIRFRNGTMASNVTQPIESTVSQRTGPSAAGALVRYRRDVFSSLLYSSSPPTPPFEEQAFLGNTTDNITSSNYAGEETPFYISLLPIMTPSATGSNATINKRASTDNDTASIPPPAMSSNGSAGLGQLYPLATSQPLRLYDRGLSTEHYGFYTYFDRSILYTLPSAIQVTTQSNVTNDSGSDDGGALLGSANALCTFSQTRFIVKIWTNSMASRRILVDSSETSANGTGIPVGASNSTASAFDFSKPGSFAWPVTVSLDRHGGKGEDKGVYCYGVDAQGNVQTEAKAVIAEDRASGGTLISPADGPFAGALWKDEPGIDGGSGGCGCSWQNWS